MKKISYFVAQFAIVAAAMAVMPSCSGSDSTDNKSADGEKKVAAKEKSDTVAPANPVIRYVDDEKLMEEYNLAKDFKESSAPSLSSYQRSNHARTSSSSSDHRLKTR